MHKGVCEHLLALKLEKVANHFAKAGKTCTGNKKHTEAILGLCLSCGEVRCDSEQNQCSLQHSYGTKHPLVYRKDEQDVYCFSCKQTLGEQLPRAEESNKKDKLIDAYEKIIKLSQKYGEKIDEQGTKPSAKAKKNKNEQTQEQQKFQQFYLLKKEQEAYNEGKPQVKLQVFGLKNLGNTCFFNSIMQCLYSCEAVHRSYYDFQFDTTKSFGRVGQINLLFKKYLQNTEKCFSPKSLFSWAGKVKGAYRHFDQQDAQEFLAILLNGLIDGERFWLDLKYIHGQKIAISQKVFGFFLASRLECLNCSKVSWCFDFSLELAVQLIKSNSKPFKLPQGNIPPEQVKAEGLSYPPQKSSDTFLDVFFAPEALTSKNYFTCEGCGTGKAWRKFYIRDPPQTLIISLKRFNNNLSKNNSVVKAPYRLDLQGYCLNKGPLVYQLFAISEHSGSSHGGHYVAYTRRGSEWYYFSDSSVKSQSWQKVRGSQPYILFYKRIE